MAHAHDRSNLGIPLAACWLVICCVLPAGAGVQQWTTGGPPGAYVYELAVDPVSPSTVYMAGFGVWKTTDGGGQWTRLRIGLDSNNIRDVAINPDEPSIVLAGSYDAGVFRSTDGGTSWNASSEGLTDVRTLSLAIDPSNPSIVYAGMRYVGAFKSSDGGLTWTAINNGLEDDASITALAIDPADPETVFAGTYDGVYMTTDGGENWSIVDDIPTRSVASLAIDPTNSAVVYVGMEGYGVYKSTDGGATFSESSDGLEHTVVEDMAIDPVTPSTIHLASDGGGIYRSLDAGATWVRAENGPRTPGTNAVAVEPASPDVVYAGCSGAGVHKSTDGGETWQAVNTDLDAGQARALTVDPGFAGRVWAATGNGPWLSDDHALSWTNRDGDLPLLNADAIARVSDESDELFLATWRGLFTTDDGGTTWTRADDDETERVYEAVAAHPVIADRVYAGNWSGLLISTDGGETWEQPETGPRDMRVVSFAFDPTDPSTMYAGAWDGIFRSDDTGDTWTSSLEDETIWSIAVDPSSPSTLYVCTYHGVFKSTDGAATWSPASDGLTAQYCWALAVDPHDPSTIYQGSGAGVFRSTDAAAEWSSFAGLEDYNIYDLQFSPDGGTLYAATRGGGVAAYTFGGAGCSIECSAIVPATTFAGSPTYFQAEATAVGCSSPPSFEWDFGDDNSPSAEQNIEHAYDETGSYAWTMTAEADGASCTATGDIEAWEAPAAWYVPGIAHAPGGGGTVWRSDLAAVNPGPGSAAIELSFIPYDGGDHVERSHTLAAGHAVEWNDVLVSLFGLENAASEKGTVGIRSGSPVHVTARTYNQTAAGTFGQYLPALPSPMSAAKAGAIGRPGDIGVIPGLKKTDGFRSNLGVQNLSQGSAEVEIKLFSSDGQQLGSTRTQTVQVDRYWQMNDVFQILGAGSAEIAYATAEVISPDGLAWFYGSVVDNATGDPTTVPVLLPRAGSSGIAGIAHAPGAGGTTWRTDIAVVNLGSGSVQLTPEFTVYNGGDTAPAQAALLGRNTKEWMDVLVNLFGFELDEVVKGTLNFGSLPDVHIIARTYNQTAEGTFGQYLPAVTAAEGFGEGTVGVIPQLKKNAQFRSNLGVLNLSDFDVETGIRLFDDEGSQLGTTKSQSVRANEYYQINNVFGALGAGQADVAYATVEVSTPGGRIWAYGSVVDEATGDPTTIPALTR